MKHTLASAVRIFTAVIALFAAMSSPGVEIIAHRGASADAPENTVAAMKLAWAQGADAVELDLWLSKDGKLVVFHDATTKRFDGAARKISELTLDEARALDVGAWKGEKFRGERIPLLEEILATIPTGKRAVLEIKCGPEIVPELARVLRSAGRPAAETCVISFSYSALAASKKELPTLEHFYAFLGTSLSPLLPLPMLRFDSGTWPPLLNAKGAHFRLAEAFGCTFCADGTIKAPLAFTVFHRETGLRMCPG